MSVTSRPRDVNHLLAALTPADRARLQPHLELVKLPVGTHLYEAGAPLRHVYLPTTAVISLLSSLSDGSTLELAMVGKEGVAGVCGFLGGRETLCSGVVFSAGDAWRIEQRVVAEIARACGSMMQEVLRYLQALFIQIAQTSACNRYHAIEQQLCRWLLLNVDRVNSSELRATQERIALMLGVRREGITMGAGRLQSAGLIRYGRGRISILDRKGLEQRSCECYSVIRQSKDRLLQPLTEAVSC